MVEKVENAIPSVLMKGEVTACHLKQSVTHPHLCVSLCVYVCVVNLTHLGRGSLN